MTHCLSRSWPGNIRELENFLKFNICMFENNELLSWQTKLNHVAENNNESPEKNDILVALKNCNFNVSKTSVFLNMPRTSLHYKMKKHGISLKTKLSN